MKRILWQSCLALTLFLVSIQAQATIFYVDDDIIGGDGTNWAAAFGDLQQALDAASSGDEIWVAAGIYYPSVEYTAGNPRSKCFRLLTGVTIYGGFAGVESSPGDRDINTNETTLSGDIGVVGDSSDNSYHVFLHTLPAVDGTGILDGFTITGGNANGSGVYQSFGGGMCNFSPSRPTIRNCKFIGNSSSTLGGGMYNEYTSPTLSNCIFTANTANIGGGMSNYFSSPVLTDCTFVGNSAHSGGGMSNSTKCYPTLSNCTFDGNSATLDGGGMANDSATAVTLSDCTFRLNTAEWNGGGMQEGGSSTSHLNNCTFSGNTAKNGGGIHLFGGARTSLTNCVVTNNSAESGGGIFDKSSLASFTNCTIENNMATSKGGGMYTTDSWPTLANTLLKNNSAQYGGGLNNDVSQPSLTNCTLKGNTARFGGGMYNSGGIMPTPNHASSSSQYNSVYIGNTATSSGGAIANGSSANSYLYNCTISGNKAGDLAGGIYAFYADTLYLKNCIVWGNEAFSNEEIYTFDTTVSVTYSNITGFAGSDGNIDANPAFVQDPSPGADDIWGTVDDDYGDVHLVAGSPCIDIGLNTAASTVTIDMDGESRIQDGNGDGTATVDLGADEFLTGGGPGPHEVLAMPWLLLLLEK